MAISKTIGTKFGIDLNHHVIFNIEIFRAADHSTSTMSTITEAPITITII